MTEIGKFFKLSDIVEKAKNEILSLPTVQRGFVWKPYQIENLWDSLLRGYPVGSFVLSEKTKLNAKYELLDGQQRASAICLGFYNPLDNNNEDSATNNKIFKTSTENIMIFIDLAKPDPKNDNRKYIFRVITKSHPWGYRRKENQKTLESKNITKAMGFYKTEGYKYLKKPLKEFWPYDSYKPIPLGLFLNAEKKNELKKEINEWKKGRRGLKEWEKTENLDKKINSYSIEDIFNAVETMREKQEIPLLFLNLQKLLNIAEDNSKEKISSAKSKTDNNSDENEGDENGQKNVENRNLDEIENLFIRLNSGGTPLSGEELNYSILKAQITSKLQNQIEEKCKGLFKPPRFITIAFRLFNNIPDKSRTDNAADSISMKIKPKQFQRNMKGDKKGEFIEFIKNKFIHVANINEIKKLLTYNEQNNSDDGLGLPSFVSYTLADKAPEVMFMLLYRLLIKKDKIEQKLKPKVLGMITLFTWLGKGEKQRDHGALLKNIWPCVKHLDTERFWSNETIQRAMLENNGYEILTPFPRLKRLKRLIPPCNAHITKFPSTKIYDSDYGNFIKKIFFNKDIILYAQRAHLSKWFHEIEESNLNDTNRAFDWDHICPQSYIYKKHNVNRALKDWYNSNGNLRAWPYSLNRSEQDLTPSEKLNPEFEENEEDISWWKKYLNKPKLTEDSLKDYLLEASFCEEEWLDLNKDDLKNKINNIAKQIINCILERNYQICKEWYNALKIDELIPESFEKKNIEKLLFEKIKRMWKKKAKKKEEEGCQTYNLSIGENNLKLYFRYYTEDDTLEEDGVEFGIYNENDSEDEPIENIKISKKLEDKYMLYKNKTETEIYTNFTLISYSENSIIDLFKSFNEWLKKFPDNKIKKMAIERFHKSIKKEHKKEILNKN